MSRAAVPSLTAAHLPGELEELFAEHYQLIYRTAYSVTGSRHDADDVVQTLFLKLLRRGLPPDFNRNPKGYLYRAAVNLALSIVRGRKREQAIDDVEVLLRPVPPEAAKPDNERQRALVDAVAQLNPRAVEILILHYEHGYTDAEIAKMLATSRGAIAVNLFRSRARLRKLLRAACGER